MIDLSNLSNDDWDILSALRGPDNGNTLLKIMTTAVIRYQAGMLPEANGVWTRFGVRSNSIDRAKAEWRTYAPSARRDAAECWDRSVHFQHHVIDAFAASGLQDYEYWLLGEFVKARENNRWEI